MRWQSGVITGGSADSAGVRGRSSYPCRSLPPRSRYGLCRLRRSRHAAPCPALQPSSTRAVGDREPVAGQIPAGLPNVVIRNEPAPVLLTLLMAEICHMCCRVTLISHVTLSRSSVSASQVSDQKWASGTPWDRVGQCLLGDGSGNRGQIVVRITRHVRASMYRAICQTPLSRQIWLESVTRQGCGGSGGPARSSRTIGGRLGDHVPGESPAGSPIQCAGPLSHSLGLVEVPSNPAIAPIGLRQWRHGCS